MAVPPAVGIDSVLILRSPGWSTKLNLSDIFLMIGVKIKENIKLIIKAAR
jgi:hypothetical protein